MTEQNKRGARPDPCFPSKGSVRFDAWVKRVGVPHAVEAVGCGRSTIWNYRAGIYRPRWDRMVLIKELCRISVESWRVRA